jgi:hypothetical protein
VCFHHCDKIPEIICLKRGKVGLSGRTQGPGLIPNTIRKRESFILAHGFGDFSPWLVVGLLLLGLW